MSIHKFYVDDSSLDKSLYTLIERVEISVRLDLKSTMISCIILNPSDSRYQKGYKVKKKITSYPPPPPPWEKKV